MEGQCLCGAVRFGVEGTITHLYQCHCSLCRRQSGAGANAATIVPEGRFRWLQGKEEITSWRKETGFSSDFCRHCGSPVPNPLGGSGLVWIPVGLFDDLPEAVVVAHLNVTSRAHWDAVPEDVPHWEATPTLEEIRQILALSE